MSDRNILERQADVLGVVYTNATTDDALLTLIHEAERRIEAAEGELPEVCGGMYWDAFEEAQCASCYKKDACLNVFVAKRVPEISAQYSTPTMQAEQAEVSLAAWEYACHLYRRRANGDTHAPTAPQVSKRKPLPAPTQEPQEPQEPKEPQESQPLSPPEPPPQTKTSKTRSKPAKAKPKAPPTPEALAKLQEPKPTLKPKAKAKAKAEKPPTSTPKKKTSKKAQKPSKPKGPKAAPKRADVPVPAQRVKPVASGRERRQPVVGLAEVQGGWGFHTFESRRERERKRSPLVSQLTPGMVLEREFKGQIWRVEVRKDGYWFNEKLYPTLYMVTEQIAGTVEVPKQKKAYHTERPKGTRLMCPYSAPRFWNLKAVIQAKLDLVREDPREASSQDPDLDTSST